MLPVPEEKFNQPCTDVLPWGGRGRGVCGTKKKCLRWHVRIEVLEVRYPVCAACVVGVVEGCSRVGGSARGGARRYW